MKIKSPIAPLLTETEATPFSMKIFVFAFATKLSNVILEFITTGL